MKALIKVKSIGVMTAELYPEKAPKTVENFVSLAKSGFYKDLIFHRVIEGFMIQGGGFDAGFEHKETKAIKGEFAANGFVGNDIAHTRGVLSMARTSDPNSASSQFFVMHQNAPHLNGQYAAFGCVTDGFDVLDNIATCETGRYMYFSDVPRTAIVIEDIEIVDQFVMPDILSGIFII